MTGADIEWSAVTLAGALVVGLMLGVWGTLRVARIILEYVKRRDDDRAD